MFRGASVVGSKARRGESRDIGRVRIAPGVDRLQLPCVTFFERRAISPETAAAGKPSATGKPRRLVRRADRRLVRCVPGRATLLISGVIDLVHTRIERAHHARRLRAGCHGQQRSDADDRESCAERKALYDTAGDAQPRKRAGARAISDAVEIVHAQVACLKQRVDHAQQELGMFLSRVRLARLHFAVDP